MKFLIVEDDLLKADQVIAYLQSLGITEITHKHSYNSGLSAVKRGDFDFCILDMSLPTFDVSPKDEGYETLPYAGELLLREMKRRKISLRTVVLTQFTIFPEELDEKTLQELANELAENYPINYLGCIFYADEETSWQSEISALIRQTK
jgi:CheY-like chemotaxis protein